LMRQIRAAAERLPPEPPQRRHLNPASPRAR